MAEKEPLIEIKVSCLGSKLLFKTFLGRAWVKMNLIGFDFFLCGRQVFKLEKGVHIVFVYSRIKGCATDYSLFNLILVIKIFKYRY